MRLRKLASTRDTFFGEIGETLRKENQLHHELLEKNNSSGYTFPSLSDPIHNSTHEYDYSHQSNITTNIEWCSDGGSLVTTSEDGGIRLYITSPTLLDDDDQQMVPFLRSFRPSPIICSELHPSASIHNGVCTTLISANDVPLKLMCLIPDENNQYQTLRSFKTQNLQTEAFLKIHSLKFIDEYNFVAGSNKSITLFDLNRQEPILDRYTRAGITSCITPNTSQFTSNNGIYTGSFSNKIQQYDSNLNLVESTMIDSGNGITQLLVSSNEKYLYAISRNSSIIDILDIRMGLKQISSLSGFSSGNQRLTGVVLPNSQGLVIGSDNGDLLWYKDSELGLECEPEKLQISHTSISSVSINPKEPSILALATGDRDTKEPQVSLQQLIS